MTDRLLFSVAAVALSLGGVWMVVWPAQTIRQDRDEKDDAQPPTPGEIWRRRILGIVLCVAGAYTFYALLTGAPGAEGGGAP